MKKVFTVVLSCVFVALMSLSAFAAEFVPSVASKNAPSLVADANGYVAYVKDSSGNVVSSLTADDVKIIPYSDRALQQTDAGFTMSDVNEKMNAAYAGFADKTIQKGLDESLKAVYSKADEKYTVDNMVVSDLFYLGVKDEFKNQLTGGNYLEIAFKTGIKADEIAPAVLYACDSEWKMVDVTDVVNNGEGSIVVKFASLCPVALLVAVPGETVSPQTSSPSAILWVAIAAVVACGGIGILILAKKCA